MSANGSITLTLANIQDVDNGKIAQAFNMALRQICDDIQDRPNDKTARKVVLTLEAKPLLDDETGALDTIGTTYYIEPKLPKRKSKVYPVLPTGDNTMLFNPQAPQDPRQMALYHPPQPTASDAEPPDAQGEGDDEHAEI